MVDKMVSPVRKGNVSNTFCHFSYFSNEKWLPLPDWARYYLELGSALSNYTSEECRFVIAIATPIRNFVASLIAAGIIVSRVSSSSHTSQSHISKIESLPIGTPLTFRSKNTKYNGIYLGTVNTFDRLYFKINYQKGGERWIPYEESYKIEPSEKEMVTLPNVQSGRHLEPPSSLLIELFESNALNRILTESRLDCILLGQQKHLQQELCNFPIGYTDNNGSTNPGRLVDLVRVRGSQFQSPSLSYRSYVLSPSNKYTSQFTTRLNSYVTIFDNAQGFLRWGEIFRPSNQIIVLDKTERNFDLAVKAVNEDYFQNRVGQVAKLILPNSPSGVDMMLFETSL